MVQRDILAATKDVPIMFIREGYVSDMGLKSNLVVIKDAPTTLRKEECATNTERRGRLAATKDVPIRY